MSLVYLISLIVLSSFVYLVYGPPKLSLYHRLVLIHNANINKFALCIEFYTGQYCIFKVLAVLKDKLYLNITLHFTAKIGLISSTAKILSQTLK